MQAKTLTAVMVVAAGCLAAAQAHADWEYTAWGMTPSQVIAASKGMATASTERPGEQVSRRFLRARSEHQSGRFRFTVAFYFDDAGRLNLVKLRARSSADCSALENALRAKYGKPDRVGDSWALLALDWDDPSRNNRVSLELVGDCILNYAPLADLDAGGL